MKLNFLLGFSFSSLLITAEASDYSWSSSILRSGLSKVGFNSSSVDRILADQAREPVPFVYDLRDDNYDDYLYQRIQPDESSPLSTNFFPNDAVFVITVYSQDAVSEMLVEASDAVAQYNSSAAGGSLPANMFFSRIDYNTQTILPTLFWLWKVPVMVIATNNMQDLRFYQIGHVAPYQHPMAGFLADRSLWELRPVWTGKLAPGGEWSNYKLILAKVWAYAHSKASKVPTFILLMGSGALVNVLIGFFHRDSRAVKVAQVKSDLALSAKSEARHQERQALKKRLMASDDARKVRKPVESSLEAKKKVQT